MNDATRAQVAAADPNASTWLSANAGSGKTRVLIDRVARLLLAGTQPQRILCLTYTKAAASEMQNRLFARLGKWAMLDDEALREELRQLGEPSVPRLSDARTLFARAIEAPGGLKIQTIHSFCSAVLRQFPLEAGVSPQFRELDESGQKALIDTVLDELALADDPCLAEVARISSDDSLTALGQAVAKARTKFATHRLEQDIRRRLGVPPNQTLQSILETALPADDLAFLRSISSLIATSEKSTDQTLARALASLPETSTLSVQEFAEGLFLTGKGAKVPFSSKVGIVPTKDFREGPFRAHVERFNDIILRIEQARLDRLAFDAARKTAALHAFAQTFLPAYEAAKNARGVLDFDDLIHKSGRLLTSRSLEWVLYRLDGGIEHILVDEAQDTSPDQWNVIDALAREITSGQGAKDNRTIFVVGDKKQSIYSFQGADAEEFDRMRETFSQRLSNGPTLELRELHYSFRSSTAILNTVDNVFDGDAGRGVDREVQHRAFHTYLPGRVDLWPLIETPNQEEKPAWHDPVDRLAANDPKVVLARRIAKSIQHMIENETIPGENGKSRRIRAGDFLILVQGRGPLFDHIIRACKAENLPMAGADRLKIGGELAVRDLLALLSFLALPEDSLSLASALRSPLFGWSESDLYDLAHGRRQGYLWAELRDRRNDFPQTFQILTELRSKVDFLRPYELLELILSNYRGRERLIQRLGLEAQDGIDELLNQALAYERDAVPSLTGFLTRAQTDDIEIKRQSDSSGDLIRVMTVHGAKGLESPIVILPDTTRADRGRREPIMNDNGVPVWQVSGTDCPPALKRALDAAERAERNERQRLLYVAMTRAETWLIVCGAESRQSKSGNWYLDIENALEGMDVTRVDTPDGPILRAGHGDWPTTAADEARSVTRTVDFPAFLNDRAHQTMLPPALLAPSELGGDKTLGGARDEETALRHGRQIHRLLEFLPFTEPTPAAATRILDSGPDPLGGGDVGALLDEALGTIRAHPGLFSGEGLAEVSVAAFLPSLGMGISGTIDRLLVNTDCVTAIDFKTNPIVPASAQEVPSGILRQMGAYLEALEQIYPDRRILLRVLWTRTATITELPHAIVRQALSHYTTS